MVSGDIRFMPIFVGVLRFAGEVVSNESAVVENASFLLRSPYLPYISKFTRLRAVSLR